MSQQKLNIEGMTCGGCEQAVRKAISQLDGVSHVDVSLATHSAEVEYDNNKTTLDDIQRAVREAGYGAATPPGGE